MKWNISSECISVVMLCIIWIYSRKGNPLPNLKNKLFQFCFFTTMLATVSNICSTLLIYNYQTVPLALNWAVALIYFVSTPLMGVVYFFYTLTYMIGDQKKLNRLLRYTSIPAVLYLLLVLTNPFTKWIFDINLTDGYVQGPLILTTYLIFYLYTLACVIVARRKTSYEVDPLVRNILTSFPLIAVLVVIIQQFFPSYILSGSAATCALLIIYLYLQNKQLSLDQLTGVPNRQEFFKILEMKSQEPNEPFTILLLSLRGFKTINDRLGQVGGNILLQKLSEFLQSIAKENLIFRYSGDEFAILINGSREDTVTGLVHRIRERLIHTWQVGQYNCRLGGVIAVIHYPLSTEDFQGLLNGIEYTVQQAKQPGSDNFCFCTPELLERMNRRNRISDILRDKLQEESFELYYQPILSVESGFFTRAEALLRIPSSPIGPIYPNEFIPIAEDTGLIIGITYQILDVACKFVRRLLDEGVEFESISVNFSAVQFGDRNLASKVCKIIDDNQIPYSKIKIEITESLITDNFEVASAFMDDMHRRGIHFGLDDFGTGYSNISSVLRIPLDIIKLDKSLVWSSINNQKSAAMAWHLTHAFRESGMRVLAEGVETTEQSQFVVGCGCDYIQGFLYAKPMPGEQAAKVIGTAATV